MTSIILSRVVYNAPDTVLPLTFTSTVQIFETKTFMPNPVDPTDVRSFIANLETMRLTFKSRSETRKYAEILTSLLGNCSDDAVFECEKAILQYQLPKQTVCGFVRSDDQIDAEKAQADKCLAKLNINQMKTCISALHGTNSSKKFLEEIKMSEALKRCKEFGILQVEDFQKLWKEYAQAKAQAKLLTITEALADKVQDSDDSAHSFTTAVAKANSPITSLRRVKSQDTPLTKSELLEVESSSAINQDKLINNYPTEAQKEDTILDQPDTILDQPK